MGLWGLGVVQLNEHGIGDLDGPSHGHIEQHSWQAVCMPKGTVRLFGPLKTNITLFLNFKTDATKVFWRQKNGLTFVFGGCQKQTTVSFLWVTENKLTFVFRGYEDT